MHINWEKQIGWGIVGLALFAGCASQQTRCDTGCLAGGSYECGCASPSMIYTPAQQYTSTSQPVTNEKSQAPAVPESTPRVPEETTPQRTAPELPPGPPPLPPSETGMQ